MKNTQYVMSVLIAAALWLIVCELALHCLIEIGKLAAMVYLRPRGLQF